MAYTSTNLTTIAHLKALAERAEATYAKQTTVDKIAEQVSTLEAASGESNVIESISVNGTVQTVTDKNVDITVPTTVSELTNDSDYQTEDEVATTVATAIAASGHASFTVVESVPDAESAESNILYLVMNSETGYYDIYALVSGSVVLLDDTTIDLTDYATTESVEALLAEYTNTTDLTSALSEKVDTADIASDDEVTEMLDELYGSTTETEEA